MKTGGQRPQKAILGRFIDIEPIHVVEHKPVHNNFRGTSATNPN